MALAGGTTTLTWDPNTEPDLAGYKVYQGTTSGSYGPSIDVGNTLLYTASNLQPGGTYYFAPTAYDTSGNESIPSNEISQQISGSTSDITPPTVALVAPQSNSTLSGTVTVSATAIDNIAVMSVQFHMNGDPLGIEKTTTPYSVLWDTTSIADGAYTLTATARDAVGNVATSTPVTVTVANTSLSPLIISNVTAATDDAGVTGYTITRNGAVLATVSATSYADTGLTPSTSYTYTITATDAAGNTSGPSASTSATTLADSTTGAGSTTGNAFLSWLPNQEPDLAGYKVYYGTAPASYSHSILVGLPQTSSSPYYTVTNLPNGATYYLAVTA